MMQSVRVEIVHFVDEHQPGVVECVLTDAASVRHHIVDKVPMFTSHDLWSNSIYPCAGIARCEVLERFEDSAGRKLARVTVARPDGLEAADGTTEFVVPESMLTETVP